MKNINKILLAFSLFAMSGVASAVPIAGTIKFGGDLTIDFDNNSVDILGNDALVTATPSGSFSSYVSYGDIAVYNDFVYDPFVTISPLWTVGGFSFTLNDITVVDEQGGTGLFLAGTGTFSGNGFDATDGAWSFSADSVFGEFAFSSVNVPEPAVALLLGVGLIGFGMSHKLRKTA